MYRRRYLLATAATVGFAGCASLPGTDSADSGGSDEEGDDTPDDADGDSGDRSLVEWRQWIPPDIVDGTSDTGLLAVDQQRVRTEFPPGAQEQWTIDEEADQYGVAREAVEWVFAIRQSGRTQSVVMMGDFDAGAVLDTMGVSETDTEAYRDYRVVNTDSTEGPIAVSDSAIVLATEYRDLVDASEQPDTYLGASDDDWNLLLSSVRDGTVVIVTEGAPPYHTALPAVTKSGTTIDATGDGTARLGEFLHFDSASAASRVAEDSQQRLFREAASTREAELLEFRQDGHRIIIRLEEPTFEF